MCLLQIAKAPKKIEWLRKVWMDQALTDTIKISQNTHTMSSFRILSQDQVGLQLQTEPLLNN